MKVVHIWFRVAFEIPKLWTLYTWITNTHLIFLNISGIIHHIKSFRNKEVHLSSICISIIMIRHCHDSLNFMMVILIPLYWYSPCDLIVTGALVIVWGVGGGGFQGSASLYMGSSRNELMWHLIFEEESTSFSLYHALWQKFDGGLHHRCGATVDFLTPIYILYWSP